jgi:hypothetical protein
MATRLARLVLSVTFLFAVTLSTDVGAQELPPVPSTPDSDDDTGGHETPDPGGKDHASATAWQMTSTGDDGGQEEFITIGQTHSEMDEDGANRSKATGLSIMGTEIVGASSQARNGDGSGAATTDAFCFIEGVLCPGVVFATTENHDGPNESSAESQAGLVSMCIFDGGGGIVVLVDSRTCALQVEAITSYSLVTQDKDTGEGEAYSESTPLLICAYDEPLTNSASLTAEEEPIFCAGAFSASASETNGASDEGDTFRFSLFFIETEEEFEAFDDNETFWADLDGAEAGDGECPEGITFGYCAHFNQGESFEFPGGAGSRQEAMHAVGFSEGEVFGNFHFGVAETLVRMAEPPPGELRVRGPLGGLAVTGAGVASLLGVAAALLLAGVLSTRATARRET